MIADIGRWALLKLAAIGRGSLLLQRILLAWPQWRSFRGLILPQLYNVGVLSLLIIGVSGAFIGMVLALQGYYTLNRFGAEDSLGQMVALALVRELGPVVTALLFAGRAGSALTAEIALLKSTEQLAAMELMGVDPIRRVLAPRFWASVWALPMLCLIFMTAAVYGGALVGVSWLAIYEGAYWANMAQMVSWSDDVLNGLIKAVVFAVVIAWIAVFQGYDAKPTSEGIGRATTNTVVYSSLAILALDFVLTALMFGGL